MVLKIAALVLIAFGWIWWFRLSGLGFWILAAKHSDEASEFFESSPYWYIGEKPVGVKVSGPFSFYMTTRGRRCKLWCDADAVESTQTEFKSRIRSRRRSAL